MHGALSATTYFSGKNDVRDSTYSGLEGAPEKSDYVQIRSLAGQGR